MVGQSSHICALPHSDNHIYNFPSSETRLSPNPFYHSILGRKDDHGRPDRSYLLGPHKELMADLELEYYLPES